MGVARRPGPCQQPHLGVGLQVVVEHVDGDGEVPVVEGIRPIPALGAKLAALGHHRMKVAQGEEDALELDLFGAHLQGVLRGQAQVGSFF